MKEYLRIEFDRADRTYRFGETITGKVVIGSPRGDQCKAVRLHRFWRTHGKGNVDKGEPTVTRLHTGPLSTEHLHEFEFEFPAPTGPFTYHGRYLNVDQYVEVQVDLPWTRDPKRIEEYVLLPGKPVAPPPSLLEVPENPVEDMVPGCSAALGSMALVVGVIMLAALNPMGFLFLLGGGFFFLPWLKTVANKRMGKATAYLTSLVVGPGGQAEVEVKLFPQKPTRINRAVFELQAREVCVAGSGSSRRTHYHKIFRSGSPLFGEGILEEGTSRVFQGSIRIPDVAPSSFKGGANKILWEAKVQLDIPGWPDWVKTIPFVVWPDEDLLGGVEERAALPCRADSEPAMELEPSVEVLEESDPDPEYELESDSEPVIRPEPEVDPDPVILSEPEVEPEPDGPSGPLHDAVRAILVAKIFGGERDLLIRALMGKPFDFTLEVRRVDRSFGAFSAPEYRNGQTVTGTVLGSDLEVAVFFPENRTEEVKGWEPGSLHSVRGEVSDWDRLRKRPELHARG